MTRILLISSMLLAFLSTQAQQVISGKVLSDADQTPLAGAVIKLKGTDLLTQSADNGSFQIRCNSTTCELEISSLGHLTKTVLVDRQSPALTILMETDSRILQEVTVSTGYQQAPRERSTGSFNHIDNKTFNRQVSTDILSRLEAVANGLTVDRGTNRGGRISIRGLSSIEGPKDALIILDNFPYEGDINNINPNDVEDITILKDAAAASIWGAKAGNGVIVITTKKGKFNQPVKASVIANVGLGAKPDLSYVKQMSSADFIDVEQLLYNRGFYNSQINSANRPVLSPVVELLNKRASATAPQIALIDNQIADLRNVDIRDQYARYLYQNSLRQQYALNLSGGSDKAAWSASAGHDLNSDDLNAKFSRTNLRFFNTFRPLKGLSLTSGIYFTQSQSTTGRPGLSDIGSKNQFIYTYAQFADDSGKSLALPKDWRQSFIQTAGNGRLLDWNYYPLEDYKHATGKNMVNDILVNTGVDYQLFSGVVAGLKYTYERQANSGRTLNNSDSYFARDVVNTYTMLSPTAATYRIPKGGILDQSESALNSSNLRLQLNYNRTWKQHDLAVLGGSELRRTTNLGSQNRFYGYNDNNLTHGRVDLTTAYTHFITGGNIFIPNNNSLSESHNNFNSWFGNAAYTYQGKYTLSVSGRRDASNLFGLRTNDQWNPFWSAGASWLISDEKFFSSEIIPYLRLRATYGLSGNIDGTMVAATTINYAGTSQYTSEPYARFSNYYNSELRWETSGTTNLGLDFSSRNNALRGSIEYYIKKGSDLFGPSILDYTGGVGAEITKNVASMKGRGLDIELHSQNINRRFKWFTDLNFSTVSDRISDYLQDDDRGSNFINTFSSVRISGIVGKPVYAIYSYKWAGLDPLTGNPRGYLGDQISTNYSSLTGAATRLDDLRYHGSAMPRVFGSLGNTLSWKNLSLNFALTYKFGYFFRRESLNYSSLFSNWVGHSDFEKRWQKPGDETSTNVPAFVYPTTSAKNNFYAGSEMLVEKGDHIRLQYINLGYDLSRSLIPKLPVNSLTLFANVNNLGLVWKANKQGIDPDYSLGSNRLLPSRIFAFGIRTNLN